MGVLWIGRTKVHDPERLKSYGEGVRKALEIYKPQSLVRAGAYRVLEGEDRFDRYAVMRFDSMDHALSYYNSAEYQAARVHRLAATSDNELVLVEDLGG